MDIPYFSVSNSASHNDLRSTEQSRSTTANQPKPDTAGGTETILLVDDEPIIRHLLENSLRRLGYRVLSAGDGQQALQLAADSGVAIDLLITDVIMPKMGGRELADRLSPCIPSLKVIFITGYPGDLALKVTKNDGNLLLQKPFSMQELAIQVRKMLDHQRSAGSSSGA